MMIILSFEQQSLNISAQHTFYILTTLLMAFTGNSEEGWNPLTLFMMRCSILKACSFPLPFFLSPVLLVSLPEMPLPLLACYLAC